MDFMEIIYKYDFLQYSKLLEYIVILIIFFILYSKIPKSKKLKVELPQRHNPGNKETSSMMEEKIKDIKILSSNHSLAIHNLQLENYELRNKLDKIYSNDLTENINYYKSILAMTEKIEYMQKLVFKTSELNDKFDRFTQYVNSRISNV